MEELHCSGCGTPLTESTMLYSDDGEPQCQRCADEYETRRQEAKGLAGAGIERDEFDRPKTKKGVVVGVGVLHVGSRG